MNYDTVDKKLADTVYAPKQKTTLEQEYYVNIHESHEYDYVYLIQPLSLDDSTQH